MPDVRPLRDATAPAPAQSPRGRGAHLVLAGIGKSYDGVVALAPTDLDVQPGEFFSLIGPSGSGKSTLLGAVAGFVPPTSGQILIDGRDVVAMPPYRRNIGMVFQNYALFPHMSVAENIAFPLRMRRLPKAEVEERVRRMLDVVRLPGFGDRAPSQLSGGQQQRVALARSAVYDPALLLMDEPLGALDKNLREEMQYEIKRFHAQIGATVLYVTHDQDEAATMSDRLAILERGRIVQAGRPRELYEAPVNAFVASFLGEANLFRIVSMRQVQPSRVQIEAEEGVTLSANQVAGAMERMVACVRPEAIVIGHAAGAAANSIAGQVVDVIYTAGTLRYRVDVGGGHVVTVRRPSQRQAAVIEVGAPVHLSWDAADTLLIPLD